MARPGGDAGRSAASSAHPGEPQRSNRFLSRELRRLIRVNLVQVVVAQVLRRPLNVQVLQARRETARGSLEMTQDTPGAVFQLAG